MADYAFYCDDSGKKNTDYMTFCGYLGAQYNWESLSRKWWALRDELKIPAIHMGEIMHPDESKEWGAVKEYWKDEWINKRDAMLIRFAKTIAEHNLPCYGSIIHSKYFRSMQDSLFKKAYENPLFLSTQWTVQNCIKRLKP